MIETDQLTRRYGSLTAVDGLTIRAEPGQVLGLLGPNGAGKTTAMRLIAGFLAPTSGTARVCGHDVVREPLAARRALGYLPEGAPSYGEMTVREFLVFIGRMRGLAPEVGRQRFDQVVSRLQLEDVLEQCIDTLSKGLRRRVGLAQAILHDPPVLMLDEPTDGLDPNQKHAVRQLIDAMARERTILISTHLLEEVHALCNRVVIIARGRLLADATPAELEARSRYHGAVSFSAPGSGLSQEMLGRLPQVTAIEVDPLDGRVTVFPRPGERILEPVENLLRQQGLEVSEIQLERGRLDEVFRQITLGDGAEGRA
ncbi:ABC transporter ATP-binding protein [Fulvimonas soli]|jgi:ABC-2 type transport system ATP-binding protein|uniref:ABC-2 type transport system ATP-binding protein n=1 Tax=Fulvimonas soli TaxID=155197 RepID=A0A316HJH4_9GAMM|nr:ABC transporter ATP-binding protein [Fulvimonas soli]PWK81365.1 ABC-2 type transport system ATP-binding protein [Fulvimonas soli]TNY26164.1 ABC transporter ATP-binding protein [Fulvimonas soli]